ncbi:uncharacterized oxidoreductase YoxD-like [Sabethes cyaneus]|uniref:uncharacterized oxidoreductase YoxD-like n=1 Tax=Sabethes cyaneus TaxID=53552 RepID=UPI00237DB746|nr:uncharacterized oxidoreductase YoxD-like [Sabethes cyaneus]
MSKSAAYLRSEDGAYDAADSTKDYGMNHLALLFNFIKLFVLLLPRLMVDFFHAYIWAPKKSIRGQVALVTGGANGFGKALSIRLAKEGCSIAIADIDMVSAQKTAAELRQHGFRTEPFKADVSDPHSVHQLRLDVENKLGPVDILVNNAGLLTTFALSDASTEDVRKICDVNLMSHLWMVREFKDGMVERSRGHIVGISSILGFMHASKATCYCVTKFAVRGLMKCLDDEFYQLGLEKKVVATGVYPIFMTTRQSLIDLVIKVGGLPVFLAPEHVADATVNGILKNRTEIIVGTPIVRQFLKIIELVPISFLHVLSEACVNAANSRAAAVYPNPNRLPVDLAPHKLDTIQCNFNMQKQQQQQQQRQGKRRFSATNT